MKLKSNWLSSIHFKAATVTLLTSVDVERVAEISRQGYECIKL